MGLTGPELVNPCYDGSHDCDTTAQCIPLEDKAFQCRCGTGYSGDGHNCQGTSPSPLWHSQSIFLHGKWCVAHTNRGGTSIHTVYLSRNILVQVKKNNADSEMY